MSLIRKENRRIRNRTLIKSFGNYKILNCSGHYKFVPVAGKGERKMSEELKSATEPGYGNHIVQYSPEYSLCAGCETCSIMCGLSHEGYTSPSNSRIRVNLGTRSLMHEVLACQQCDDHPCYEICPRKDKAMKIDPETGVVYIVEENCIGCSLCQKKCKFTPSRIQMKMDPDRKKWKAVKCDLCRGNPEGPQCIKWCQVRCIGLSNDSVIAPEGTKPSYIQENG